MQQFLRIENRGGLVVIMGDPMMIGENAECALNKASLLERIKNIEAGLGHPNKDTTEERQALAALELAESQERATHGD